ncbi:MAG: hypothetical protein JF602_06220, partial [Gemmatimonadetes bacterium]|nr:hypothetical protein [Gemmatimonadota bacterium]
MEDLKLLDCFGVLASLGELIGQHEADVVLAGAKIRELLEGLESLGVLSGAVHPIRELEKVLFRVAVEALFRRDLAQLVVDLVPSGSVAKNLVAESDGVVEVATVGVKIDCLLVVIDRLVSLVQPQVEVPNAVINRDVAVLLTFRLTDYL